MKRNLTGASLLLLLTALLAVGTFAQTPAPQSGHDGAPLMGRMGRRFEKRGPGGDDKVGRHVLRQLNLTDTQRQQLREIESRYAQSFRARREELRGLMETRRSGGTLTAEQQARLRQLREEVRDSAAKMREEIHNLLTPEQREQLKGARDDARKRHMERHGMMPPAGNINQR